MAKHDVESVLLCESEIIKPTKLIVKIIKTFEHARFNSKLPHGSAFKQEVPSRVDTNCNIVERFVSSYSEMLTVTNEFNSEESTKIISFLQELVNLTRGVASQAQLHNSEFFPALSAVVDVFRSIHHPETLIEENKCTIVQDLQLSERLKYSLCAQSTLVLSCELEKFFILAGLSLNELKNFFYYELWCAARIIFPELRKFIFINGMEGKLCKKSASIYSNVG